MTISDLHALAAGIPQKVGKDFAQADKAQANAKSNMPKRRK